jgi:hypothetical protein
MLHITMPGGSNAAGCRRRISYHIMVYKDEHILRGAGRGIPG